MIRTFALVLAVVVGTAACSSGDSVGDAGCVEAACAQQCHDAGFTIGFCGGGRCLCSGSTDADADGGGDADDDAGADADGDPDEATEEDAGPEDAVEWEADPCAPASCGPVELCGESGHGDGIDNNCNDAVDEGCPCGAMDTTIECFPGDPAICPAGEPCRGGCIRGVQTCGEFDLWSYCEGAVTAEEERCDGVDNDCDGRFDEDIPGCDSPVICPDTITAAPMTYVPLDGGSIYPGAFDSWLWTLTCPTTVVTCPTPEEPTARDTQVLLISSGTYHALATIRSGTNTYTCEFAIVLQGEGLRVELTWDTQGTAHGDTDVDLHLHQWGAESDFHMSPQDCYYGNCKASDCCGYSPPFTRPEVAWDLDDTTDLAACRDAPQGEGAQWEEIGFCANPRLDVDVITCTTGITDPTDYDFCAPENINVDNPPLYEPMRIMVNYYSEHSYSGVTNASINVYCGGALRATFGPQPLTNGSSYGESNDNWMVADVMFYETGCGLIECEVVPLDVVQRSAVFGPPWSAFAGGP